MEVRLLTCLLLLWLPSHNASWLSFEQGKIDEENQYFSNPQSNTEELDDYDNVDGGATEDIFIDKRSVDEPENFFNDLKENIPLPDDDQQNILKEFSQASKDVPGVVRDISELMREEIGQIEKDVALPFSNMLQFDGTLLDYETPMDEIYATENLNQSKEDGNYASGEANSQEEIDDSEASTTNENGKEKEYAERPSFQQSRKEVEIDNGGEKNSHSRSGVKKKGTYSFAKAAIKGENESPSEGSDDDDDDLDSPVVFGKRQYKSSPVHAEMTSASFSDLEELGNLVVNSKTGNDNGESRGSSVVNKFALRKDNVSKSNHSEMQIEGGPKLDANTSSSNRNYSTPYSMSHNDNYYKQEWSKKNQLNLDKPNERSKRSKLIENKENDSGSKKSRVKVSVDDDVNDDDYIRLKKSGIFENIADAFAHIDKTRKENERKENERMEKRKKSTLEEIHNGNPNQPVNGGFTPWTAWSECSESCGKDSIKMRMRVCTNPPPSNGGNDCQGWRFEVKYCKLPGCKEQQEKVLDSKAKTGLTSQRKETVKEDVQQPGHVNTTVHTSNASLGEEGVNKTTENVKQQRSKTNRIIEAMFKDVIHKAFDKSKNVKANTTKATTNTNETKSAPIEIHKDSGLIASENEVDTIDDAPDTSQDMESEGMEIPSSQNMESEGQLNSSPKDMESRDKEIQSIHNMESEGQPNPQPKEMDSGGQEMESSQDMELEDPKNMESEEEKSPPNMEKDGEANSLPQDQQSSQDEKSQGKENSSSQDVDMELEENPESEQNEDLYTSQESDSTQTSVKPPEESPSAQEANVKPPEESPSTQEANVKPPEERLSAQEANVKPPEESPSAQEANVKPPEESPSAQEANVKQSEERPSAQEANVKPLEDSQPSRDTNVKPPEENKSSEDTNAKQSKESQSSQDTSIKQSKESQASQDTNVKQSKESQASQDTNVKESKESQSSQDINVKQSEESQASQDTKVKESKESQSSQDTNVKQSKESQASQDTKVKESKESQSSQDTNVKESKESQASQDTNVKESKESQASQDTKVKESKESQSSQDTYVKQSKESQASQDTKVKESKESQSSQDTNVKESKESQASQDTKVKESKESQSSQDTNAKQSEESQASQDTKVKESKESQSSQVTNVKQSEESYSAQNANSKQGMKNDSSKKGKPKTNYNSIDGNFDMVMKTDEKDQDEKTEIDIAKVATEILKHNDADAILKALSDNDTETLDSYDADATNVKNQESHPETNKPHFTLISSNHSKVNNNSAIEKGQDNHHATEKNEKDQEHGTHDNQTAGNHSSIDAPSLNEQDKEALSSEATKSKNGSSGNSANIKVSSHDDKDANKDAVSGASNETTKGEDTLKETKEKSKQKTSKNQEELDSTITNQGEKLEMNTFSSDQESFSSQKPNDRVASIDWGNLHALNALVEILAEHETNGTHNSTSQSQNDTLQTINNAALIGKKTKSHDVTSITQGAQAHDSETVSFFGKGDTKINMNNDDYTKHDGDKRQNVTGEGNARSKENLTMPENPNARQTASHMIDTSKTGNEKNREDTPVDARQGSIKKTTNSTKQQDNLFNLLKEVVLNLQDTNDSNSTTKLDELEKQTNTTKVNNENNNNTFTSWTAWTTCSKSCGQGTKTRMRKCLLDKNDCKGPLNQTESCQVANCPAVDGGFTEWSAWSSACNAKCGEGVYKTRTRTCTNPVPQFGGKPCKGTLIDQQDCKLKPCEGFEIAGKIGNQTLLPKTDTHPDKKEKGYWGQWSEWSACTASCGGEGYSSRERSCLPGKQCKGPRYDTKECGTDPCPVDGGYTPWTAWSPCTPSCGLRAYRMRTRNCTNPPPSHGGRKCYESALETEPCKIVDCPIDGGYTSWSSWSPCTKTCGTSVLSRRERVCSSPEPRNGGRPCQGDSVQIRECGKPPCPVNGGFREWSSWTPCANVSCASNLFSSRNRSCDNPRPQFGGKNCTGNLVEKKSCRLKECPIDGGFSSWSAWSACPKNCKVSGVAHRRRTCDNPKPQNRGRYCIGPKIETKACSNTCPVDGGFTEWTSWSKCSQECGRTSIKSRERYCTNPSPANGGIKCKGSRFQVKICRSDGCPVNGNYTAWSDWTSCPRCGFGVQTKERTCTNPSPINGGKECEGPAKQTLACPFKKCRDNGFGQWSSYGHCSKSCGGGAKMRRRTCEDESKGCDGKFVQLKPCNKQSCVLGKDHVIDINPVSLCGFNPCKMSRCLGYPQAKCLTSSGCWPVFFDKRGNTLESCKGDKTVFTSSPEMICHSDPCKVSGCYTDEAASCHVSLRCKPVFLDSAGNKLDCRGLLNVPPSTVCGVDPCEGSSCDLDSKARCIADYDCEPVFISAENEILGKCKVNKYRDNNYIINSKAGKKAIETNPEMENMKSQLQAFLSKGSNEKVETIAEYNNQQNPEISADQQYDLAYKLQNLKKRNRFYKPRKTQS